MRMKKEGWEGVFFDLIGMFDFVRFGIMVWLVMCWGKGYRWLCLFWISEWMILF